MPEDELVLLLEDLMTAWRQAPAISEQPSCEISPQKPSPALEETPKTVPQMESPSYSSEDRMSIAGELQDEKPSVSAEAPPSEVREQLPSLLLEDEAKRNSVDYFSDEMLDQTADLWEQWVQKDAEELEEDSDVAQSSGPLGLDFDQYQLGVTVLVLACFVAVLVCMCLLFVILFE